MQNPLSMRFWRKAPLYLVDICRNSVYSIMVNVNSFKSPFIYIMSKKVKTSIKIWIFYLKIFSWMSNPFLLSLNTKSQGIPRLFVLLFMIHCNYDILYNSFITISGISVNCQMLLICTAVYPLLHCRNVQLHSFEFFSFQI